MNIQSIKRAVEFVDGTLDEEKRTSTSLLESINLPRQFKKENFADYIDPEDIKLIRSVLTKEELSLISKRDATYINDLSLMRSSEAKAMGQARSKGTLQQFLDSQNVNTNRAGRSTNKIVQEMHGTFGGSRLKLIHVLPCIIDSFVWRPAKKQNLGDWVRNDSGFELISDAIGFEANGTTQCVDLAYYQGVMYNLFPDDSSLQVISTDHEHAWKNVSNEGRLDQFLREFMSTSEIVDCLSTHMDSASIGDSHVSDGNIRNVEETEAITFNSKIVNETGLSEDQVETVLAALSDQLIAGLKNKGIFNFFNLADIRYSVRPASSMKGKHPFTGEEQEFKTPEKARISLESGFPASSFKKTELKDNYKNIFNMEALTDRCGLSESIVASVVTSFYGHLILELIDKGNVRLFNLASIRYRVRPAKQASTHTNPLNGEEYVSEETPEMIKFSMYEKNNILKALGH